MRSLRKGKGEAGERDKGYFKGTLGPEPQKVEEALREVWMKVLTRFLRNLKSIGKVLGYFYTWETDGNRLEMKWGDWEKVWLETDVENIHLRKKSKILEFEWKSIIKAQRLLACFCFSIWRLFDIDHFENTW
jgi:hypothetical protein